MLVLLSGVSGSGKNTVINLIRKDFPDYKVMVSTTTRPMRIEDHESEGHPYHFISDKKFKQMITNNKFFEWNKVHGDLLYGLTNEEIQLAKDPKNIILKDIDVEGHQTYLQKLANSGIKIYSVYLTLPPKILKERLLERGESLENIKLRLSRSKLEDKFQIYYDDVIKNFSSVETAKYLEGKIQDLINTNNSNNAVSPIK